MDRYRATLAVASCVSGLILGADSAQAGTEVKLDKDFMAGVLEKLPPSPFEKKGQYKGTVNTYRLVGIEPRLRRLRVACQVEGVFKPPVSGPISERISRSDDHSPGTRKFRFQIRAGVNIEAASEGTPRFRVDVEEIRKDELEGFAGLLARLLGKYFDDIVTQIADGRAAQLNQKLNAEVMKRANVFKEYGIFCGIDYDADNVVLRFDLTKYRPEGIVGHVFPSSRPGTVPLYRWFKPKGSGHFYTTNPGGPDRPGFVSEGIACHVLDPATPGTVPIYVWRSRKDNLYTASEDGEGTARIGYRPEGIAFHAFGEPQPETIPLYRFYDPRQGRHFYTTHPHAEFAK